MLEIGGKAVDTLYVGSKLVKQVYVGSKKVYPDEEVIPKQIRDAMVLWYDIKKQGATNESMAENPVLVDHSGNGHDATCYNFAWSGMSGIGGYGILFKNYNNKRDERATFEFNGNYTIIKQVINASWQLYNSVYSVDSTIPAQRIKVTGVPENKSINYQKRDNDLSTTVLLHITEDGIYDIPQFTVNDIYGFEIKNTIDECNIIIEQLPLYPNALVSDGVDDYAMVEGLPTLPAYSVVAKEDINYNLTDGVLSLFRNEDSAYSSLPLYSFLLFNRTLTPGEIDWVKTNLMD